MFLEPLCEVSTYEFRSRYVVERDHFFEKSLGKFEGLVGLRVFHLKAPLNKHLMTQDRRKWAISMYSQFLLFILYLTFQFIPLYFLPHNLRSQETL